MTKNAWDWNPAVDRRIFIKGVGVASTALITATLGGCEALHEQIENRPVRRRLRTGSADVDAMIAIYKDAVVAMQALPGSNPRSWEAQSGIHGTVNGGFNFCQHGTSHFFSWHRAYLLYFEQICQELTGQDDFGLPYWNWNQNPDMHPEFTDPSSILKHPRDSESVAGFNAFSDATLDTIFSDTNFFTFSSQIEGTPHNLTHSIVGGDMVTGGSPLDPIFWAHHCMVDYCWAKWNIELENDNTNDESWLETSWNHFFDGNGNPVEVTAGLTTLMPLLSYRYESSAVGSSGAIGALNAAELRSVEERVRRGADVRLDIKRTIPIARGANVRMGRPFSSATTAEVSDMSALLGADEAAERVFVRVHHATLPDRDDFFVRVFINLPEANSSTPTDDPHYAGSFAFFGTQAEHHGDHGPKREFLVDATPTLRRLRASSAVREGQPISVQLVPVPITQRFRARDVELALDRIDLIVTPVRVRSARG
jgi:tyrosinase